METWEVAFVLGIMSATFLCGMLTGWWLKAAAVAELQHRQKAKVAMNSYAPHKKEE